MGGGITRNGQRHCLGSRAKPRCSYVGTSETPAFNPGLHTVGTKQTRRAISMAKEACLLLKVFLDTLTPSLVDIPCALWTSLPRLRLLLPVGLLPDDERGVMVCSDSPRPGPTWEPGVPWGFRSQSRPRGISRSRPDWALKLASN